MQAAVQQAGCSLLAAVALFHCAAGQVGTSGPGGTCVQGDLVVMALVQLFQAFQEQEAVRSGCGPAALEPLLAVDPAPLRGALAQVSSQATGAPPPALLLMHTSASLLWPLPTCARPWRRPWPEDGCSPCLQLSALASELLLCSPAACCVQPWGR